MKDKERKKIEEEIGRLKFDLLSAITKKKHGGKEVNIQDVQTKINKLQAQLT